jgi:hypothetical protein
MTNILSESYALTEKKVFDKEKQRKNTGSPKRLQSKRLSKSKAMYD